MDTKGRGKSKLILMPPGPVPVAVPLVYINAANAYVKHKKQHLYKISFFFLVCCFFISCCTILIK